MRVLNINVKNKIIKPWTQEILENIKNQFMRVFKIFKCESSFLLYNFDFQYRLFHNTTLQLYIACIGCLLFQFFVTNILTKQRYIDIVTCLKNTDLATQTNENRERRSSTNKIYLAPIVSRNAITSKIKKRIYYKTNSMI